MHHGLVFAASLGSWPEMNALEGIEGLSECIGQAIQDHLAKSNINIAWPQIDSLNHPILRFEAFIEDAGPASAATPRSARVASVCFHPLFFISYEG
jgi:ATP-dependent RNA helicase DDX49/DBP8